MADIMRALGQNPTNKDVAKILGNPSADGEKPVAHKTQNTKQFVKLVLLGNVVVALR